MIAIDSNIWIYYFDAILKEHNSVRRFIEDIIDRESIATSTVILLEVAHYLYNVSSVNKETLGEKLLKFVKLSNIVVIDLDLELYGDTIKILSELSGNEMSFGGRDASIIAMMRKLRVDTIATHDKDFKRLENLLSIRVVDPTIS